MPDEFDQYAVKPQQQQQQQTKVAPPPDEFDQYKVQATPTAATLTNPYQLLKQKVASGEIKADPSVTKDSLIDFARPFVGDAMIAGGTALGGPIGTGLGLAGAGLVDALLQHLQSKPPTGIVSSVTGMEPGGIASTLTNTGEMLGLNALGGKLVRGAANLYKEYAGAGGGVDPQLRELGATVSQYLDSNSWLSKTAKFVEDTFARNQKLSAQKASGQKGVDIFQSMADSAANRPQGITQLPQYHSELIQQQAIDTQRQLIDATNRFAAEARRYKPVWEHTEPIYGTGEFARGLSGNYSPLRDINPNSNPLKYQEANANATAAENLRASLFDQEGLKGLINDPNVSAVPFVDKILKDKKMLQRALDTQSLPLAGTTGLPSNNMRGDLQGYYMNKLIDDAATRDSVTGKIANVDPQKIINGWADQGTQESRNLLFNSRERADIEQFLTNLGHTQQKMANGFGASSKMWLGAEGLSILAGMFSGHVGFGAAAPVSLRVGGYGIARMMSNPKIARLLVAAASGQPLGQTGQLVGRGLADALNGVKINAIDRNGKETEGTIKDGEFVPLTRQ